MRAAAERALELDPLLPDAHLVLARAHGSDFAWDEAEREYHRALEINPNYTLAHQWYGFDLILRERFPEALYEIRLALKLDPLSLHVREMLAYAYLFSGDYGEAVAEARQILAADPTFPRARMILGRALFLHGEREAGIRELYAHNRIAIGSVMLMHPPAGGRRRWRFWNTRKGRVAIAAWSLPV